MSQSGRAHAPSEIATVRALIASHGVDALTVNDLTPHDLPRIAWSGCPSHLRSVARQLTRVSLGEVDYLAVRAPSGKPIAKGGVDYAVVPGVGLIWQLATQEGLQGLGVGTLLIENLEDRIERRGLRVAMLSVDEANVRPRRLYERLGYRAVGERVSGWEVTNPDGSTGWYEARLTDLRKDVASPP